MMSKTGEGFALEESNPRGGGRHGTFRDGKGLSKKRASSFRSAQTVTGEGFALKKTRTGAVIRLRLTAAICSERFALISFNTSAPIAGHLLKPRPPPKSVCSCHCCNATKLAAPGQAYFSTEAYLFGGPQSDLRPLRFQA